MFETVQNAFQRCLKSLRGETHLDQRRLAPLLADLRQALLEADVALEVLDPFLASIEIALLNGSVQKGVTAEQLFLKTAHHLLTTLFSQPTTSSELNLKTAPPAVILLVGLQGSGKTTTAGKLALYLKQSGKRVLLSSVDCYRPAAFEQLKQIGEKMGVEVFDPTQQEVCTPLQRAESALAYARQTYHDVLIIDSAGRSESNQALMQEIGAIHRVLNPVETLLVADAMLGQQAANIAKRFADTLALTGIILTKLDGDAKAGAAIALTQITQKPIKFSGKGEKLADLEKFIPDRIAARILGIGDIATLLEKFRTAPDSVSQKIYQRPHAFNLQDFQAQIEQLEKLGGAQSLLEHLPHQLRTHPALQGALQPKQLAKTKAIFLSMTMKEKQQPELIKFSRKRRIAQGSGTSVQAVNQLLNQYETAKKTMVRAKQTGFKGMMQHAQALFRGRP